MDKPLLLIDVDGVISLFGFDPARPPSGRFQMVDGIAHYLSATAGAHLRAVAERYELVWCTGWEEKANDYLPHALGLEAPLPHVSFDRAAAVGDAHWKLPAIDAYAGAERSLAWIDDALDDRCRAWARARPGATLLVDTAPATGLCEDHVTRLLTWAAPTGAAPRPR
jgi:hypothetical protein